MHSWTKWANHLFATADNEMKCTDIPTSKHVPKHLKYPISCDKPDPCTNAKNGTTHQCEKLQSFKQLAIRELMCPGCVKFPSDSRIVFQTITFRIKNINKSDHHVPKIYNGPSKQIDKSNCGTRSTSVFWMALTGNTTTTRQTSAQFSEDTPVKSTTRTYVLITDILQPLPKVSFRVFHSYQTFQSFSFSGTVQKGGMAISLIISRYHLYCIPTLRR
jgi:hypothetical protein